VTYSASVTGHGASADDAKEAFSNFVRALRQINGEGDSMVAGQISGTDNEGTSFSLNVGEIQDLEAEDTSSDENEESPGDDEAEAGTEP
jgi:hypothetical protein